MAVVNSVVDLSVENDIALLTINSPPVNALSVEVREGIREGINRATSDAAVKAVVILCAGRTFIAGGDISEFGKPPAGTSLPETVAAIENCPKPIVAMLHGTALGGGFEIALASHYRIAVPSARIGLPEIKLGLIPGAGGTQRLTRLVGPRRALQVILSGDQFSAAQAKDWGVVDAIVDEGDIPNGARSFARALIDTEAPLRKVRDIDDKVAAARGNPELFASIEQEYARKFRGFEAWKRAIAVVRDAVELPFEEGLKRERAAFLELMETQQSKALRHVFFAQRQVWKIADIAEDTPRHEIKRVGVIGAGTMGGGIAMTFLNIGVPVTIVDTSEDALQRGLTVLRKNYDNSVKKGRLSAAEVEARTSLLQGSIELGDLGDADLIIEAVYESMELKKDVFRKLDLIKKPGAILATNTSYLNVDEIAAETSHPDLVVGMHFFSPANVMRLVEIVRGEKSSKSVVATAMDITKRIGKIGVLVGVCHGFVGNRMLAQRQRQAQNLVLEGAMPWDVDRVLYDFGMPMGPFAMSDLAGLNIGWSPATSRSSTLREILCEHGRLGQKTRAGYYDYDEERNAKSSPVVERMILDFRAAKGFSPRSISDQEILERCLYPLLNEGAKILEEGKAQRASDIDIVWINGYGWPAHTGGPMYWADSVGLRNIFESLSGYHAAMGEDFRPAALLERLVLDAKGFSDL